MNNKRTKSAKLTASPSLYQVAGPPLLELLRRLAPPEEARRHFQSARIEMLKGFRALIDARIERFSKATRKGEKIDLE